MNKELALELVTEIITKFEEIVTETKNSIRDPFQIKELEDDLIRSGGIEGIYQGEFEMKHPCYNYRCKNKTDRIYCFKCWLIYEGFGNW